MYRNQVLLFFADRAAVRTPDDMELCKEYNKDLDRLEEILRPPEEAVEEEPRYLSTSFLSNLRPPLLPPIPVEFDGQHPLLCLSVAHVGRGFCCWRRAGTFSCVVLCYPLPVYV